MLFLPPWAPEWNPMEPVWNTMVARLHNMTIGELLALGSDSTAKAAINIASNITHEEVESFCRKCGY